MPKVGDVVRQKGVIELKAVLIMYKNGDEEQKNEKMKGTVVVENERTDLKEAVVLETAAQYARAA